MYANPHAGIKINQLPSLSPGRHQAQIRSARRVSAKTLAAVHAAWQVQSQAQAAAALPAYTEIDYAAFRTRLDHRNASAPVRQFITRGNSVLIAGRRGQVLAKLELPRINQWGVARGARYFTPTRPCKLPLRTRLELTVTRLFVVGNPLMLLRSPLKRLKFSLIKMHCNCKTASSRGRAGWQALVQSTRRVGASLSAPRHANAAHQEPHWTTIRLTA